MAASKALQQAQETLAKNRHVALGFVQQAGERETKRLLQQSAKELEQRIKQAVRAGPGEGSYTVVQMKATLAQVKHVLAGLTRDMQGVILERGKQAAEKGADGTAEYLRDADKAFRGVGTQPLALRTTMMLEAARGSSAASILRRLAADEDNPANLGVLQRYGVATIGYFEKTMQSGLLQRKSWPEMQRDITEKSPFLQAAPAYWAQRIVRTEVMGALNRGQWEATREANKQLEDMTKILSATFDDRTGADSYAVHGQIRRPDEAFEWWDGLYQHPPNRPNDREIVVPHRIRWPLPPYLRWRDAADIARAWKRDGRKGEPPERPMMTTVPLGRFGRGDEE